MAEKRLIDANALRAVLKNEECDCEVFPWAVDNAPTVDAVEVVHGHWIVNKAGTHKCSVCHDTIPDEQAWCGAKYCPYCGAKMDGGYIDGEA